jgi:hypothetical protein
LSLAADAPLEESQVAWEDQLRGMVSDMAAVAVGEDATAEATSARL